ncbi:MAG: hypothetical protein JOZ38_00975, partial [Candidatus Eremiobacteraeota bacterium]|nr:hypothetical protein [Candidatus Eremiobacteraeota bacterium]
MIRAIALIFSAAFLPYNLAAAASATSPGGHLSGLQWRLVGPFRAGRSNAVTGVPGDPRTFYFGAVGGGVWKSTNAGRTWSPIFDSQAVASIGAIAVAPSNHDVVYVGTGEADMRSDIQAGNGVYRSDDAGRTWTHLGLDDTRQIGRIAVDPNDANTVFVAALGHQYSSNAQRGVFKSIDGGKTWQRVLYVDDNTGAIDVQTDPKDGKIVYASMWHTRRPPWNVYPPANGPGGGLYKSTDGGATWQHLTSGLPSGVVGRIGLALAPSNAQRIYAAVDNDKDPKTGGVYRSDDAGATWHLMDNDERVWKRGWYFSSVVVDPANPDMVYVSNTSVYRSTDGGKTFIAVKGSPGGDDYHQLWIDPTDGNRMILGSDQGTVVSLDGAQTWSSWYNQPTGQMYHVITDSRFPYWIYAGQQDSGAMAIASRSNHATISFRDFFTIDFNGESSMIAPDPLDPRWAYLSVYPAAVDRLDTRLFQYRNVAPYLAKPAVYHSNWTPPIVFSMADKHALYFGTQVLFRTTNGGGTWAVVSPDLTRRNPGVPPNLDASTAADAYFHPQKGAIYAIAPSPLRANTIWAGTDDGTIHVTFDGGAHWNDVTPPALTAWSKVGTIEASHGNALTAYAAIDRHRLDDRNPYIYRTRDGGKHWQLTVNGIPNGSFVNAVREDPKSPGLLFAATETAVYVSFNAGDSWQSLRLNMPVASMRDVTIAGNDLIVATHGRAFWSLDDIAPLRELTSGYTANSSFIYRPATAIRFRLNDNHGTPYPLDEPQADNPPTGAILDYYLATTASRITLDVADAQGRSVRRFSSTDAPLTVNAKKVDVPLSWFPPIEPISAEAGGHRVVWDFHAGACSNDPDAHCPPLVPPGTYSVRMTADGTTRTVPLTIVRDPRVAASDADLRAQYELATAVWALLAKGKAAYAEADALRKKLKPGSQLTALNRIAGADAADNPDDSEGQPDTNLHSLHYINASLQALEDAIEGADFAPTPDMHASYALYQKELARTLAFFEAAKNGAVPFYDPRKPTSR